MVEDNDKPASIRVSKETRDCLMGFGRKGDTYDDIVMRLITFFRSKGGEGA